MKKRIFSLVLVLGFLLACSASAWAADFIIFDPDAQTGAAYNNATGFGSEVGYADSTYSKTLYFVYASSGTDVYWGALSASPWTYYIGGSDEAKKDVVDAKQTSYTINGAMKATVSTTQILKKDDSTKKNYMATVTVSGKPSSKGTYKFKLWHSANTNIFKEFTITVKAKKQTAVPKFTTAASKVTAGTHGQPYEVTIQASGNIDDNEEYQNIYFNDETQKTALETLGFTISNNDSGDLILKADQLLDVTSTSGQSFTICVSNDRVTDKNNGVPVKQAYKLVVNAAAPKIVSPDTTDLTAAAKAEDSNFVAFTVESDKNDFEAITFSTSEATTTKLKFAPQSGKFPSWLEWVEDSSETNATATTPTDYGAISGKFTRKSGKTPVAGTHNIVMQASNKVASVTKTFTLVVLDSPDLSATKLNDVTYGKPVTFNITTKNGTKDVPVTVDKSDIALKINGTDVTDKNILTFEVEENVNTGNPKITIEADLNEDNVGDVDFGSNKEVTGEVEFTLESEAFDNDAVITLPIKFVAVKPTIEDKASYNNMKVEGDTENAIEAITIEATGPGKISWDVSGLPAGLASDDTTAGTLKISGTPTEAAKNKRVTIKALNGAGNDSINMTFNIDAPAPVISFTDTTFATSHKKGDDFTAVTLTATNGPVTWKAQNLPGGIKLDAKTGELSGKFSSAFADKTVTITASNAATGKSGVWSSDAVAVYDAPKITTSNLGTAKVGTAFKATLKGTNISEWDTPTYKDEAGNTVTISELTFDATKGEFSGTFTALPTVNNKPVGTVIVHIAGKNDVFNEFNTASKDVTLKITATAPKIATSTLKSITTTTADSQAINFSGTLPISYLVYIKQADAVKFGADVTDNIVLGSGTLAESTSSNGSVSAMAANSFNLEATANGTSGINLVHTSGGNAAKNLPIVVSIDNGVGRAVVKTLRLTIDAAAPEWLYNGAAIPAASKDIQILYKADAAAATLATFTLSGDTNVDITSGLKNVTNSVSVDISGTTVTIKTLDANGDAKTTTVALTAKSNGTGKSAKVTVKLIAQAAPAITNPPQKVYQQGKTIKFNLTASGTKPLSWDLGDIKITNGATLDKAKLGSDYGISFDKTKGAFVSNSNISKNNITKATDNSASSLDIEVKVGNAAGIGSGHVFIQITGGKPKIATKTLTFTVNSADSFPIDVTGAVSSDVTWTVLKADGTEGALSDYSDKFTGLTLTPASSTNKTPANIAMASTGGKATKGTSVKFKVDNFGQTATGAIKIIIKDVAPEIDTTAAASLSVSDLPTSKDKFKLKKAVSVDVNVALTTASAATGDSKVTWKVQTPKLDSGLTTAITASNLQAKITKDADDVNKATLRVTLKNGAVLSKDGAYRGATGTVKVTAQNSSNTVIGSFDVPITISVSGNSGAATTSTEDVTTAEESEVRETSETMDELVEDKVALGEGELSIGAERAESTLTAEQRALIESEGYMIAAILPEISATADGQYGLEVDLFAAAPAGAELKWLAFPQAPAQPS
ncbi:MAG: hypothetical protein IJT21_06250, partial [Synergistaceae bacterium]|nr:hypothetical protein [Synergistaceae bacterium]